VATAAGAADDMETVERTLDHLAPNPAPGPVRREEGGTTRYATPGQEPRPARDTLPCPSLALRGHGAGGAGRGDGLRGDRTHRHREVRGGQGLGHPARGPPAAVQ